MVKLIILVLIVLIPATILFTNYIVAQHAKDKIYRDWKVNNPLGTRTEFESWWRNR